MPQRKPLRIELPPVERLRFGRVGAIAAVGFGIGVLWPHLAGVRLVPTLPSERGEANTPEFTGAPIDTPASAAVEEPVPAPAVEREPFSVSAGEVTSCRDRAGNKLEACDPIDFDAIARGRIATLAACEGVERLNGVLSLGFELDFAKNRLLGVTSGKSTSLSAKEVERLLSCMRQNLGEVSLQGIRRQHERYTLYYRVDFGSGVERVDVTNEQEVTPASGRATVAWDVGLVREAPSRDALVIARILQGTRIAVTGKHGDWYRVKYDTKGAEGWVFRTAIGM